MSERLKVGDICRFILTGVKCMIIKVKERECSFRDPLKCLYVVRFSDMSIDTIQPCEIELWTEPEVKSIEPTDLSPYEQGELHKWVKQEPLPWDPRTCVGYRIK